jgi:hypothetical protein
MISFLKDSTPINYSGMLLITWLNLLQYMRYFSFFRFFIDLIVGVTFDSETLKFLIVWTIGVFAFATTGIIMNAEDNHISSNFYVEFRDYSFISFGDFGASEKIKEPVVWFFFTFSVLFLTVVMMNLLIGILSKAMERVLVHEETTNYSAKCQIVYDMEVFYYYLYSKWVSSCCKNKKRYEKSVHQDEEDFSHLVFAEKINEEAT